MRRTSFRLCRPPPVTIVSACAFQFKDCIVKAIAPPITPATGDVAHRLEDNQLTAIDDLKAISNTHFDFSANFDSTVVQLLGRNLRRQSIMSLSSDLGKDGRTGEAYTVVRSVRATYATRLWKSIV